MKEEKCNTESNEFALIMHKEKPEAFLDLFTEEEKDIELCYLVKGGRLEDMNLLLDEESLLNGLLIAYPQGPPEGDPEEFRSYARRVLNRISENRGYHATQDMVTDQSVQLYDMLGETAAQMGMITAGMIKSKCK